MDDFSEPSSLSFLGFLDFSGNAIFGEGNLLGGEKTGFGWIF